MRTHSLSCLGPHGFHRIVYREWGEPDHPHVVVCVHGLTRNSRDFDPLAAHLAKRCRVICPDIAGRGESPWLPHPGDYGYPLYLSDMAALIARAGVETVDWVGTSMGGLIGMGLASLEGNPLRRLVLNDIGPTLDHAALGRIGAYIGHRVMFDTQQEAEKYIRDITAPFGPHTELQWRKLANDVLRQDAEGKWIRHYDPQLAVPFKSTTVETTRQAEAMMWAAYDAIRCPTLLVRGAQSDLLSAATAGQMTQRGPKASLVQFEGVGHAPTLMHGDQIAAVQKFLLA